MYFDIENLYKKIENGVFVYTIDGKIVTKEQFEKYMMDVLKNNSESEKIEKEMKEKNDEKNS